MMFAITTMIVAAACCIIVFIIAGPRGIPVLAGQRWNMPGLGSILIIETDAKAQAANVKYQLENGEYGFCTKHEIRYMGKLLPYKGTTQRDAYINNILNSVRDKNHKTVDSWEPYNPPRGWAKKKPGDAVYDAEIVNTVKVPKRPRPKSKKSLGITKDDF